jgi:hypothetical protein
LHFAGGLGFGVRVRRADVRGNITQRDPGETEEGSPHDSCTPYLSLFQTESVFGSIKSSILKGEIGL